MLKLITTNYRIVLHAWETTFGELLFMWINKDVWKCILVHVALSRSISRVHIEGEIIRKPAQSREKSSIKMHNIFLINVGPVIIFAVACRLTGCRPCGNQCFNVSQFCSQSIHRNTRFFALMWPITNLLGRTEMRTHERKEWQLIRTVWDISWDDRARTTACRLRTATDRFKENYSIDIYIETSWVTQQRPGYQW